MPRAGSTIVGIKQTLHPSTLTLEQKCYFLSRSRVLNGSRGGTGLPPAGRRKERARRIRRLLRHVIQGQAAATQDADVTDFDIALAA